MRIRSVKPDFFMDEDIAQLHPLTRLFFIGLWCAADSEGRLEERPLRLKASILPYDNFDCEQAIIDLATAGFIIRYSAAEKRIIQVRSFTDHQRITGKEADAKSKFPPPPKDREESLGKHPGNNGETPEKQPESLEGKGKDRKGKDSVPAVAGFLPDILAELAGFPQTWAQFRVHRRQIRKPMTPRAEELILKTLAERPADALDAIDLSIRKGWQDINWTWFDNSKGQHGNNSSKGGASRVNSTHDPDGKVADQY